MKKQPEAEVRSPSISLSREDIASFSPFFIMEMKQERRRT